MARGYVWCRHCGEPHPIGLAHCPTTLKVLETRLHRPPPANAGFPEGGVIEGRYRVRNLIGEGASGRVFLAEDLSRKGKAVAIKIHKGDVGRRSRRIEQEGKLALSVAHPHICRVLGYGRLPDGRPYIVMEALLKGQTLQKLLARVRILDESLALTIAIQLLSGLAVVHQVGIIHRDVKPSNVFLGRKSDGQPKVKLLDFGLAKPPPDKAMVYTRPGYTFGTPGYIAPELFQGQAATPRSDVWGVGVVLFEMLAGVRPFRNEREAGSPYAVVTEGARSLAVCAPFLPARLVSIVETALSPEPRTRFESADALRDALESYASARRNRKAFDFDSIPPPSKPSMLPVIDYISSTPTGSSIDTKTINGWKEDSFGSSESTTGTGTATTTGTPTATPTNKLPRR